MQLQATPEEVMRAVEALEAFARDQRVPESLIFGLTLALEECASNVVNHGLKRAPDRTFSVRFELKDGAVVITLRDDGPAFDPTAAAPRKRQAEDDDIPGGWGIELVRRNTDEIRYSREAGENVLRIIKRLPSTDSSRPLSSETPNP